MSFHMQQQAGNRTHQRDCVDPPSPVSFGMSEQSDANSTNDRRRPPEVQPARQSEQCEAPHRPFFKKPNKQERATPDQGVFKDLRPAQCYWSELQPVAPVQ